MRTTYTYEPWQELDKYRKNMFNGRWPSVPIMFDITVSKFANKLAFSQFDADGEKISYTYAQVQKKVRALATHLIEKCGVIAGEKILLIGANSTEWGLSYLAILQAGAIVVPLDKDMSEDKIASIKNKVAAKIVFMDNQRLKYLGNVISGMELFLLEMEGDKSVHNFMGNSKNDLPTRIESDIAVIMFTSGTTGQEKGVVLSHRNLVSDVYLAQSETLFKETDVFYCMLPIHHSYCQTGVFLLSMQSGAETVFAKSLAFSTILKELKVSSTTILMGIPLLFNKIVGGILAKIKSASVIAYAIIKALLFFNLFMRKSFNINLGKTIFGSILDKASLKNIRILVSGGGPLAPETVVLYNSFGLDFMQGYGLTETSPVISFVPLGDRTHMKSVGQVIAEQEVIIVNANSDGIGEIAIKGSIVFEGGYYQDPEATANAFTNDGFFKTGDLGYIDDDDFLYITGRSKNMIVTEGGKNVYPEEIEDLFQLNNEFEQVLISGYLLKDNLKSESIQLSVYPNEDIRKLDKLSVDKLVMDIVRDKNKKLHSYQKITRVRVLDEALDVSSTKKIKRFVNLNDLGRIIH